MARREAPRRLLWLPVALAGGIGLYFASPAEPPRVLGPAVVAGSLLAAMLVRRNPFASWVALLFVASALGATVAQMRTLRLATVMLEEETWASVEGDVAGIELRPAGWRLTLRAVTFEGGRPEVAVPTGVRIAVAGRRQDPAMHALRIGDRVRVRARLRPPSAPVAPGAYDFQRDAYFRGLGAVGFAVGQVSVVRAAGPGLGHGFWDSVDRVRAAAAQRIRAALPDPVGGVAAAMLLGDRAGIDEPTAETFRETGLAHLLAISGLHMGLVAGTVYSALRLGFAAWPAVALRRPAKKWAAAAALVVAAFYLLLAGAPVPTQRAFLMTGLILVAVILDREAVSLHLVAWAAAAILAIAPETLTGPSFQLSFAAVIALIAVWEEVGRRRRRYPKGPPGILRRVLTYVAGVAATSLVASLVTAPVVAHHFQQVPVLGAAANLVAVPVTAFVTMPAGVAALMAMPIGLEAWPLRAMGWGIQITLWTADLASHAPLTAIGIPALGAGSLVLLAIGGLWLSLWRTALRWGGFVLVTAGVLVAALAHPPDALISADGGLAAVRIPGHGWAISGQGGGSFVREAWQRRWGGRDPVDFLAADGDPASGRSHGGGFGCDGLGCVLVSGGRILALPVSPEGAMEDCERADLVVAPFRHRHGCGSRARLIDRDDLRAAGALAVWMSPDGVLVRSVEQERGVRPWTGRTATRSRVSETGH